ncbi:MAG TPA: MMPL family transporter [Jatrophihabitans sp.]|nr:MMPL family transporter [Jatrophihabitans sp.]
MTRTEQRSPAALPARPRRAKTLWLIAALGVLWLLFGGAGGGYQSKLTTVQKNDNAAFLPKSAESTKVDQAVRQFSSVQTVPGFVVYQRAGGLTDTDRTTIESAARQFRSVAGVAGDQVGQPQFAADGRTASIAVPLVARQSGASVSPDKLVKVEKRVVAQAKASAAAGLVVHSAGPAGLQVALSDAFSGIDSVLLGVAALVVIAILLVVYRSPVLWFFPLFSAVLAMGGASFIVYQLALHDVITLNGQSQGILSVLILSAGTDYALLLISRYREELHTHPYRVDAMIAAWRGSASAIVASGGTVIIGLLCLLFSQLNSDRSLGPVCAIGIACTVFVMLTFLPLSLLVGRWIFWPRIPRLAPAGTLASGAAVTGTPVTGTLASGAAVTGAPVSGAPAAGTAVSGTATAHARWQRFAGWLSRHARPAWIVTVLVLIALASAISQLRSSGLALTDAFTNKPDSVAGQRIFDASFPQGAGAPAVILSNTAQADQVIAVVSRLPGVATGPGAVCVMTDYAKLAGAAGGSGCPPPQAQVQPVGGRIAIDAQLTARYDTDQAIDTVKRIRSAVHAIPGANAEVGGQSAITYDSQQASRHDRNLIIPIVLVVILLVLALLLRALVAPLLLVATVLLSFAAALGGCALIFNHLVHFKNSDPGFPLFAFIFLVALGIDYNIFLMTRVREESVRAGTREGLRQGLAVTGGVITSAGVVLAATFAVLGIVPLVFLAEVGIAVAFGVLLDTIVVRSILVPALGLEIGSRLWWPSRLARAEDRT